MHRMEDTRKSRLRASAREGGLHGEARETDLVKFTCAPRRLVFVSQFSFWIHKRELKRGGGARVWRCGLYDHERVNLYALRRGDFA